MKKIPERLLEVKIGEKELIGGTANFSIQIGNKDGEYYFTNGRLIVRPYEMQEEDVSEIYDGNFEYEAPDDYGCTHTMPAWLFVDEKEEDHGWLVIYRLVPEAWETKVTKTAAGIQPESGLGI